VAGDLYIGGAGVARGYWRRPALTADAFTPDPYSTQPGGRAFRSGDRVRWRGDGTLEFLGRTDHQIKLRGSRIELTEIEVTLRRHRAVRDAVVVLREQGTSRHLVAYVIAASDVSSETIRSWLAEYLPEYMMPAAVMALSAWPLTVNGKIDRAALPAPDIERRTDTYVTPRTGLETTLAELWSEVLNVPQVGVHDNFFELGGDSIMSIQVIARAAKRGIRLLPQMMFRHPTLGELAAAIVQSAPAAVPANSIGR
jgi:aryl carrier-like protein